MAHYFSPDPQVASRRATVPFTLADLHLELVTDRGMFSPDALDQGTRVLLDEVPAPPEGDGNLADIGCGYGPIAIALARRAPRAHIWAVEVNERAIQCARINFERAGVADRVTLITPDQVPQNLRLDGFWSNPPIRIGKSALHQLLAFWLERLQPGASAQLVVHKHLGSDSLARWITTQGYPVDRLISRAGYRVLSCSATPHADHEVGAT